MEQKTSFYRKNGMIRCYICLFCLMGIFLCGGCAPMEKVQQWKAAQTQAVKESGQPSTANQLYSAASEQSGEAGGGMGASAPSKETVEILLYFTDEKGESLTAEKRIIAKEEGIARATVNALLRGPENKELKASVPEGTILRDINIKEDGVCIVDFSKAIVENQSQGKNGEMVTVAAIVQTLGQFSSVKEVQILVEGKTVATLGGQVDISSPIQTGN